MTGKHTCHLTYIMQQSISFNVICLGEMVLLTFSSRIFKSLLCFKTSEKTNFKYLAYRCLFCFIFCIFYYLVLFPIFCSLMYKNLPIFHWQLAEATLHKKWSFPLMVSSVNVTKSAGNCGFGHIHWKNP